MLTSWSQNLLATFLASSELKSKRSDGDNGQTSFWMIDISEPGGGWHWPWGAEWVLLLKLFEVVMNTTSCKDFGLNTLTKRVLNGS